MRFGRMRHLVDIQRPAVETDDRGQTSTTWNALTSLICDIEQTKGDEAIAAMQMHGKNTYVFKSQYGSIDIDTACRLVWNNRYFAIERIDNVGERNRRLEITATETA